MGILSALRERKQATGGTTRAYSLMDEELGRLLGSRTASGKSIDETSALSIAAVWACARILSESVGMLPWAVYRRGRSGDTQRADDHWLEDILVRSPNARMTRVEFREAKTLNLCLSGNAYSLIERAGDRVVSLWPIKSQNVQVKKADGRLTYKVLDRGRWEEFPEEKIWHVRGFGFNGDIGLSPIGVAREALGLALAAEEFGARFFSQGGLPGGVVTIDRWLSPDQREIARETLRSMLGGLGNAHQFALFEGGMKPEPWGGMPLEDMQFILVRKFSVLEICRLYRVPPHMVAELEKGASYASVEQMGLDFVMYSLMPYFTRFEASVEKFLLPPRERGSVFVRVNFEGLLRAASKDRAEFYASALQNGWMSRNEVRAKENLNKVDGLDEYTVQANMALLSRTAALETEIRALKEALRRREDDAAP